MLATPGIQKVGTWVQNQQHQRNPIQKSVIIYRMMTLPNVPLFTVLQVVEITQIRAVLSIPPSPL